MRMKTLRNSKNPWLLYETEVPHSRVCDPARGVSPAETLSPEHLQLLRNALTCAEADGQKEDAGLEGSNRGERSRECGMMLEEFTDVLRSVIGPDVEDAWVERFFSEVDVSCTGQVTWQQLCSYLLLEYTERERASIPAPAVLDPQAQIRHCPHNKREPTVRVVAVPHPPPLRYVSVSKGGHITVWNSSLHITKTLELAGDPSEEVANTRRFRGWATDAVYLGDVHMVAIATDSRDLHFISVSTSGVFEEVHLFGFHCGLTALCYWYDGQRPERASLLLLGDEKGGVHLLRFLNPSKGLFKTPSKKDSVPQRISVSDLGEHSSAASYRHVPNTHREPVSRVTFEPSTGSITSASECEATSVVCTSATLERRPYIWKVKQGAKCLDYSASLRLMVTGGRDRAVRLWTPCVTTRPVATLLGHGAAVLDVAIYQPVGQILSYSRDAELRIWDISTHRCLKTIRLRFPCLQPGRVPEHGRFPFLLVGPPLPERTQPHLVVGCKDDLALLTLAEARRGGGGGWTDEGRGGGGDAPGGSALTCALYNPTLRQVATAHADSSVSLWDLETGRRQLRILNAHGEDELTCMTLDSSHRRLITGARNGTIKVWNFLNGLNLHKLEPVTECEVTGLTCLHGDQLLAVGWSRRIAQYDIAAAKDLYVRARMSWKSGGVHKSDILAVCHCSALGVAATAGYDGDVVLWRLETGGPLLHLRTPAAAAEEAPSPVSSLLFLQRRASDRRLRSGGVLVSSRGGRLTFWSVAGESRPYGRFYAPQQPGERVLSLSTDQSSNTILAAGDTAGRLHIWDISTYALSVQHEPAAERPPLLRRWEAHGRELVSVEVLEVSDTVFVLTGSSDGSAGLWTRHGDHVGSFEPGAAWNLSDQATYRRERPGERGGTRTAPDPGSSRDDGSQGDYRGIVDGLSLTRGCSRHSRGPVVRGRPAVASVKTLVSPLDYKRLDQLWRNVTEQLHFLWSRGCGCGWSNSM